MDANSVTARNLIKKNFLNLPSCVRIDSFPTAEIAFGLRICSRMSWELKEDAPTRFWELKKFELLINRAEHQGGFQ
jgi:hypothetical protein